MRAIKKTRENLVMVANSICEVNFSAGIFVSGFNEECNNVVLSSCGRNRIGRAVLSLIPSNFDYRVSFENDVLKLYIWI